MKNVRLQQFVLKNHPNQLMEIHMKPLISQTNCYRSLINHIIKKKCIKH